MAVRKTTTTAAKKPVAKKPVAKKVAPEPVEEVVDVQATDVYGVADVAALIAKETGQTTSTRELRTLLRKMARDGRLDREIIAGNRARWEFAGPEDPQVQAILKAFTDGELEADKKEKLQALKERKAAQMAAKKAAKEAEADDEELEDDEDLEEEE